MIISRWMSMGVLALGLCDGLPALGEPLLIAETAAPGSFVRVPLLDRDPCDYPKIYYCTQPADVQIGRYLLKIPYNLIGQWPPTKDFIELLPRWPGLKGAIKNEKATTNFDSFDIVHILIHAMRREEPTEEGIRDSIKLFKLLPPILLDIGLLQYTTPTVNSDNIPWYYYLPVDHKGLLPRNQPLFIYCSVGPYKDGDENTIECEFGYTIRDGLYITIRFFKRHINDWKAITTSSHNLVESFVQE